MNNISQLQFPVFYDEVYKTFFYITTLIPKYPFSIPLYYDQQYNQYFCERMLSPDKIFQSIYFQFFPKDLITKIL